MERLLNSQADMLEYFVSVFAVTVVAVLIYILCVWKISRHFVIDERWRVQNADKYCKTKDDKTWDDKANPIFTRSRTSGCKIL
jgi:hypothetical protein